MHAVGGLEASWVVGRVRHGDETERRRKTESGGGIGIGHRGGCLLRASPSRHSRETLNNLILAEAGLCRRGERERTAPAYDGRGGASVRIAIVWAAFSASRRSAARPLSGVAAEGRPRTPVVV